MAYKEYPLADGRTIGLQFFKKIWLIENGIITKKYCNGHKTYIPVEQFSRKGTSLEGVCKACMKVRREEYYYEKGLNHRPGQKSRDFIEYHKREGSGGDEIQCRKCGDWRPANEYTNHRRCRRCRSATVDASHIRGHIRKAFGEGSAEYALAKNEKRHYYLKALRTLLGISASGRIRHEKERHPYRVLPFMLLDDKSKEDALEREAKKKAKEAPKRRPWDTYMEVRPMQEV